MKTNNMTNQIIFKETMNNTSSVIITPPQTTNTVLIILSTIKSSSSGTSFLIAQTAPANGVFATTNYQSGAMYATYNSNAFSNQSATNSFMFTASYESTSEYYSGNIIVTNFNNQNNISYTGQLSDYDVLSNTTFFVNLVGISPTTQATQIRIQMNTGLIASGVISAYSL